jgi:hypothetical protein
MSLTFQKNYRIVRLGSNNRILIFGKEKIIESKFFFLSYPNKSKNIFYLERKNKRIIY